MPKKRHANPWRFFYTLFYGERKEERHGSEYLDHHGSGTAARNLGGALYFFPNAERKCGAGRKVSGDD